MRGKHVLVTGANCGIGYSTALELLKMGAKVTIACRSEERGKEAQRRLLEDANAPDIAEGVQRNDELEDGAVKESDLNLVLLDLGSLDSVLECARELSTAHAPLDVLINNAGIMAIPERRETADGFELTIGVNHFGPHLLTRLLWPRLADHSRVIMLSSRAHHSVPGGGAVTLNVDDLHFEMDGSHYSGWSAYGQSKLCNVLDARHFARLGADDERRIFCASVHPGVVATSLSRNMTDDSFISRVARATKGLQSVLLRSPLEGAQCTLHVATMPDVTIEQSGLYWADNAVARMSALAADDANVEAVWARTEEHLEATLGRSIDSIIESFST